ncbi:NAD(P)-dependent oxidoreductase [Bernardetia sp.]|uniref:NAD(P)-dependent oxidoreductase n=1 Tax=Bernardetia sp. TaxID=1937974 RepID=UPI0025BBA6C0|nr:NAD(P)-dependent oxidoreductase [Bernardetia sp.]
MKYNVLVSAPYLLNDIEKFRAELEGKNIAFDIYPVKERLEEEDLLKVIHKYDAIICGDDRFTPKVIDKAEKLKVIVKWGTGIDSIDKKYAESKGVQVRNTLNAFTEPVSDSVLAMLLVFARKVIESDRIMKNGGWRKAFGITLSEVSIGIIGLGNIGRAVARKLQPFNTKIYANDTAEIPTEVLENYKIEMTSLDDLVQKSDFVVVCCDLNSTSLHIINKEKLGLMKSNAIVINMARGPLINEKDLIEALENKQIAGAGLDVFEEEPLFIDSPLRKMNNVLLSSHNVNASPYYWNKVHRNSLNMLYQSLGIQE